MVESTLVRKFDCTMPDWKPLDFNHIKNDCKGFTEETVRGSLLVLFFVILTPNKMFIQSPSNPRVKPGVKIHLALTNSSLIRFFCLHCSRQSFRNLALNLEGFTTPQGKYILVARTCYIALSYNES